jgi:hypothetical protein
MKYFDFIDSMKVLIITAKRYLLRGGNGDYSFSSRLVVHSLFMLSCQTKRVCGMIERKELALK